MKTCSKCSLKKELIHFYRNKAQKDGYGNYCKDCEKAHQKKQWSIHKDIKVIAHKNYIKQNRNKINILSRLSKARNADKVKMRNRLYYIANKDSINLKNKVFYQLNKSSFIARYKIRQTKKTLACPIWLSKSQLNDIKSIYHNARTLESRDGIKRHVDHIVPLQGKTVCGLHVPWNLQILTATENLQKHNKLEVSNAY